MGNHSSRKPSAIFITVVVLLAACGGSAVVTPDSSSSGQAEPPPSTQGGGTLSIGFEGDIFSLDPSQGYDVISWPAERLIFETLITYGDGVELVPALAEAMPEVSEDGLVYTFALREGVNFVKPDGTVHREMTADDVAFSLNRILNPNLSPTISPVAGSFFTIIAGAQEVIDGSADEASGIKVLDPLTIEVTLARPDPTFLNIIAMPFGSVVPADLAGEDVIAFSEAPVGTGPYTLESRTIGEEAIFVRNEDYWGEAPPADRIEFRLGLDANTAAQQVEANQLDIMGDPVPAGVVTSLRESYPERVVVISQVAVNFLSMDTSDPEGGPLTDLRVRQAFNYAIDKENILHLLRDRGVVAPCIYPPQLQGHNPDCQPYEYDPERARELMEEAGFGSGFSSTLYTDPSEDSTAVVQAIQQDLGEIGVEVDIVAQEFDVLVGTISTPHEAPMVYIGWFQDFPDPSDFYEPILSCAATAEGGYNVAQWCNEEADALEAQAKAERDPERRVEMFQELELMVMDDAPWVPVIHPAIDTFISERVTSFEPHPVWLYDLAKYAVSD